MASSELHAGGSGHEVKGLVCSTGSGLLGA